MKTQYEKDKEVRTILGKALAIEINKISNVQPFDKITIKVEINVNGWEEKATIK